jgi:hypothetical protein
VLRLRQAGGGAERSASSAERVGLREESEEWGMENGDQGMRIAVRNPISFRVAPNSSDNNP